MTSNEARDNEREILDDEKMHALYVVFANASNLHEHPYRAMGYMSEVVKLEGIMVGLRAVAAAAWDEGVRSVLDGPSDSWGNYPPNPYLNALISAPPTEE